MAASSYSHLVAKNQSDEDNSLKLDLLSPLAHPFMGERLRRKQDLISKVMCIQVESDTGRGCSRPTGHWSETLYYAQVEQAGKYSLTLQGPKDHQ